jgi:peptide/nickel transport system substrate-binding protein
MNYQLPSKNQWRQFFKILSPKEKIIFFALSALFLTSLFSLLLNFYFQNTVIIPAEGGEYIEGVVGQPRFLNPVYAPASDVDRDLAEILFSGLMRYSQEGEIIPDLAEKYQILENGKIYEFYLRKNLFWSDGAPLTAEDVVFTITTIQNPDYKSPLRANWLGVEVEKISDLENQGVRFKLKNPSVTFLENSTVKILPKHIWQEISPQKFPLTTYNLYPIGSGPYKIQKLSQDNNAKITSLDLTRNSRYFNRIPYIKKISFKLFDSEKELIESYKKGEIKGFSLASLTNFTNYTNFTNSTGLHTLSLPRYFALFFNPDKSEVLSEIKVRQALNYGTDKKEIIDKLLSEQGKVVHSPVLPEIYGFEPPSKIYQFDLKKAKELLDKAGFVEGPEFREKIIKKEQSFQFKSDLRLESQGTEVRELQKCLARDSEVYPEGEITGYFGPKTKAAVIKFQEKYSKDILEPWGFKNGTGLVAKTTRQKLNEVCFRPSQETLSLKLSLVTVSQPALKEAAVLLKEQWRALGVEVEIKTFDISILEREIIKPRNYEILLFGEVLGTIPDPFPFWHSSQKKDPGLNLSLYENKEADKLLEAVRQNLDEKERKEKLEKFQEILIEDAPAVFLYNPDYLYFVSREIKGINGERIIDPSKRFSQIEEWYIKTRRGWK